MTCSTLSQATPTCVFKSDYRQKNDPGKPGSVGRLLEISTLGLAEVFRCSAFRLSKPEIGNVAIADSDAGARHQQPIDRAHQPAEQSGGRREAERSSLGHLSPLVAVQQVAAFVFPRGNLGIPDTRGNGFVCIAAYCLLQCNIMLSGRGRHY